ncbi:glycosyltransferase family 4 protein [Halobacteria archaeon AArc-dxtr1]|nr:glycosyltransferase family 4 protein [Halobacteria archaeon AArc-dxtr1]
MKILYYLHSFPKLSQSFVLNEIYELDQNGHDVAVCARNRPTSSITHDELDELELPLYYVDRPSVTDGIELLSTKCFHPAILKHAGYRAPIKHHAANLFHAKRCIEFIQQLGWGLDHVHTHFASKTRFPARYVASYFDVPFTITTHAYDLYREPIDPSAGKLLQSADRIITISEYNRRYIRNRFTADVPIDIVRAGIRPEKFSPAGNTAENRIVTVSRFVEKKGLQYALEGVALATERIPDIEYHIIGSGRLEDELRQQVTELGLEDTVSFLENVSDQRLLNEIDEANCFLLPCVIADSGDRDGIPVALMEAMAMETPPISTSVSGIPELITHEENGLLVEPRNPNLIADALVDLLQSEDQQAKYGANGRQTVSQDFNITHEATKLEAVFERLQKTS